MSKAAWAISAAITIWLFCAGAAVAEQHDVPHPEASPGTSARMGPCGHAAMPCAGSRVADRKPPADIEYESVGIGDDDSLAKTPGAYNLHMVFATQGRGAYLADIKVLIENSRGRKILETESPGPIFYAKLPMGTYRITADSHGKSLRKSITLKNRGKRDLYFYWPAE